MIGAHKRWDFMFGVLGILALMIGVLTFTALFADMAIKGFSRIDANFFLSFPSRRAADAGILSAGLTLALLILPIVIVATREAIRAIPQIIREGAYACGATTWQVVRDHIVPYSSAGILTGVIIGMARAIGETAPIITIGALTFIAFLPSAPFTGEPAAGLFDWLFAPFTVMPIQMFNWTSRPEAAFLNNAAAAGFVLVLMTLIMNGMAIWLRYRLRKNIKW